jgi:hypothetical protein
MNLKEDLDELDVAIINAISMLNTIARCATHECVVCRETSAVVRDQLKSAYAKKQVSP